MYKKFRKGFTLVELVVVIAIIAILSGAAVVGYVGFTNDARTSKDESLVSQMNTALQLSAVDSKNNTFMDAASDLKQNGIEIENLKPSSENHFYAWDSSGDRIVLLNSEKSIVYPLNYNASSNNIFAICHNEEDITKWSGYSIYLATDYPENNNATITLSSLVGLDVGNNNITNIEITDATSTSSATINTNGGELKINTPSGTINHYGTAEKVTIDSVASNSYHLYGTVSKDVTVKKGRVEVTSTGKADAIIIDGNDIKVSVNNTESVSTIVATEQSYLDSADVTSTKPVSDVITNEYGALYFSGGNGTEASPYLISSAQELLNIRELRETITIGATNFVNSFINRNDNYFKFTSDIYFSDLDDKLPEGQILDLFRGTIDGDNHKIYASNAFDRRFCLDTQGNTEFKNLEIVQNENNTFCITAQSQAYDSGIERGMITFTNIITSVLDNKFTHYGSNFSSLISHIRFDAKFTNCVNNANIEIENYAGPFIGGYVLSRNSATTHIYFANCINNGTIVGDNVSFFTGNQNLLYDKKTNEIKFNIVSSTNLVKENMFNFHISGNVNNGLMKGSNSVGAFPGNLEPAIISPFNTSLTSDQFTNTDVDNGMVLNKISGLGLKLSSNQTLTIDYPSNSNIQSFKVRYMASISLRDDNGGNIGTAYIKVIEEKSLASAKVGFPYIAYSVGSNEYASIEEYDNITDTEHMDIKNRKYKVHYNDNGYHVSVFNSASMVEIGKNDIPAIDSIIIPHSAEHPYGLNKYTVSAYDSEGIFVASYSYTSLIKVS